MMDSHECGFTCLACGQFRPGPEGAHSEAACLRVQLAAANERVGEVERVLKSLRDEWPMFNYVDDTEGMVAVEVPEVVIQNFHRILGGA